ncbi:hypothetical protein GCM10028791_03530 [Echinicola sediminis]
MDKEKHTIDKLFSQKLQQHQEKPSTLAWEKLERQLGPKKGSNKGIWLRIAAVFLAALALVYLLWQNFPSPIPNEPPTMAEELRQTAPMSKDKPKDKTARQEVNVGGDEPSIPKPPNPEKVAANNEASKKNSVQVIKPRPAATEKIEEVLSADSSQENEKAIPVIATPELDMSELVAEISTEGMELETPEPVAYKISIRSSGISEKPKKENLVEGIEDKINTLGSLLGKVDQGYAELQDAKNNLFTALITKKETK